ncbi:hypothetical protein F5887DRAFT_879948, partial [Amanita rubescens]
AVYGLLPYLTSLHIPVPSDSLQSLDDALKIFHDNKGCIFVDLGLRKHFNIPKFHSCRHYVTISLYGTTDNYDTQFAEWLHIDLAKQAYNASNGGWNGPKRFYKHV